ncbi:hypothetical protein DPMN_187354 [Dreissena polymorpha]|uniref:Uncharacterized protein n=1 Tax=Dreissena polymorpha TaxID=45954 RepID=A0A9D4DPB2_DREPO|nr:hypothetical protein DPMN_187354 [Dreissena polymorpha]
MSTVGGNDETGGVGDAVPLALPTVQDIVPYIGVCTDESTEGGNGETGGVDDAVCCRYIQFAKLSETLKMVTFA